MEHKFNILKRCRDEEITVKDAALILDTTTTNIKHMIVKWKGRLDIICPLVDKVLQTPLTVADRKIIKQEIADQANITLRQVDRVIESTGVKVPRAIVTVARELDKIKARRRKISKKKVCLDVIAGLRDVEDAAEDAEVTKRSIYRVVGTLLETKGYVFRDLKRMKFEDRKRIANEIEKDENIVLTD